MGYSLIFYSYFAPFRVCRSSILKLDFPPSPSFCEPTICTSTSRNSIICYVWCANAAEKRNSPQREESGDHFLVGFDITWWILSRQSKQNMKMYQNKALKGNLFHCLRGELSLEKEKKKNQNKQVEILASVKLVTNLPLLHQPPLVF